jgi:hypothetical protein
MEDELGGDVGHGWCSSALRGVLTKRRRWRRRRTHVNSRTLPGPLAILGPGPFPPVSVVRRDVDKNEMLHIRLGSFRRCSREVA